MRMNAGSQVKSPAGATLARHSMFTTRDEQAYDLNELRGHSLIKTDAQKEQELLEMKQLSYR